MFPQRVTRCILIWLVDIMKLYSVGLRGARRLVGRAARKPTACGLEFHPPDFSSPAWAQVKAGRAGLLEALQANRAP
jgi:hypothetical protein